MLLAISVASLLGGCASDQVVVKPVTLVDVDARLMRQRGDPGCLGQPQPETGDYTVPALEDAYKCETAARRLSQSQLHKLQAAVRQRQAAARAAAAAAE